MYLNKPVEYHQQCDEVEKTMLNFTTESLHLVNMKIAWWIFNRFQIQVMAFNNIIDGNL